MTLLLFVLWAVSIVAVIYIQLRYAWANYPQSIEWLCVRLGVSFLSGALMGAWLFYRDYHGGWLFAAAIICGLAIAILDAFVFPRNVRIVIPEQKPEQDTDSDNDSP